MRVQCFKRLRNIGMKPPSILIPKRPIAPIDTPQSTVLPPSVSHTGGNSPVDSICKSGHGAMITSPECLPCLNIHKPSDFINTLPVEILGHIFELTVMRIPYTLSKVVLHSYLTPRSRKRSGSPFNLLQVCKYWREIAQSTSSLWAYLNGSQYRPARPALPAMPHWLSLSRTSPLYLILMSRSHDPEYDPLHSSQMLRIFASESHRWKSFSVELDHTIIHDFVDVLTAPDAVSRFSQLEELEISFCTQEKWPGISENLMDALIHGIGSLNSLRHLYWNYSRTLHPPDGFSWSRLETIYLDTPLSLYDAAYYITQCSTASKIIIVDISKECQFRPSRGDINVTVLPNLTFLQLEGTANPFPLLSNLVLSNLKTIKIGSRNPLPRGYVALENFFESSRPPLQRVSIRHTTGFEKDDMIGYLKIPYLHTVPQVGISYVHGHDDMLSFLQTSASSRIVLHLPRLFAWRTIMSQPYVGWKDSFNEKYDRLIYKWEAGCLMLTPVDLRRFYC